MDLDTAIPISIVLSFLLFLGLEAAAPSDRQMPEIQYWRLIGFAGFAATFVIFGGAPLLIVPLLPRMALVDLNHWGSWAALPVWVLTTFITYWTHRTHHYFDL